MVTLHEEKKNLLVIIFLCGGGGIVGYIFIQLSQALGVSMHQDIYSVASPLGAHLKLLVS